MKSSQIKWIPQPKKLEPKYWDDRHTSTAPCENLSPPFSKQTNKLTNKQKFKNIENLKEFKKEGTKGDMLKNRFTIKYFSRLN